MIVRLLAFVAVALTSACSGVGLVATDDPNAKVAQAVRMTEAGRAAQSRRLLNEAMATFQEKGDDLGLAEAHREFGFLASVGGGREGVILIRPPLRVSKRPDDQDLADMHLKKAAELFERKNRLDIVARVKLSLGDLSVIHGDKGASCVYYDQSLEAYRQWEGTHPGEKVVLPRNIQSFAELINQRKSEAACNP